MKLHSIDYLAKNASRAFARFPFSILCSFFACLIGVYFAESGDKVTHMLPLLNVMLCLALGIALYFCVDVFAAKKKLSGNRHLQLHVAATLALVMIYFTLPKSTATHNTSLPYVKYIIYNITVHLLVSFVPFVATKQLNGFWNYNKTLFIRFLTAALYSGFIYMGLMLALAALNLLFNIHIHPQLYLDLYIIIIGLFNTWFFVAGIPEDFDQLEEVTTYPKGLKIFTQYVFLPLLTLYLLILYAYGTKIVLLWSWPKGWVAYLIICVAVLGILTMLLIYPYGKLEGNSWIGKANRAYYLVLLPLIAILFVAISMRISDYGITIERYVVLLLGIWLSIVCLYFIAGKTNIKFIPVSLAIMLALVSFGPWGIFSVSERSQVNRLHAILEEAKILQNNKINKEVAWYRDSLPGMPFPGDVYINQERLSDSLHNEVYSIMNYLSNNHGFAMVKPWYNTNIDSLLEIKSTSSEWRRYDETEVYMRSAGLKSQHIYEADAESVEISNYYTNHDAATAVKGYDFLVDIEKNRYDNASCIGSFNINGHAYTIEFLTKPERVLLKQGTTETALPVGDLASAMLKKYGKEDKNDLPVNEMQVLVENEKMQVKMEVHQLQLEGNAGAFKILSFSGKLFIKMK